MTGHTSSTWDGEQLLAAFTAAARWLEHHVAAVNALNVFPVPDGDTGTNMSLTLSGAIRDVAPDPSCAVVAERVRYWAMMRGRGNSGIILSQVLRGFAQGLSGHEHMGASELVMALTQASVTAYKAVMKPVEGTMLTVIREASEAVQAMLGVDGATPEMVLEATVRAARESVARTPTLLKTLRDAGVVDAGGQGLVVVLEGMLRYVHGESVELLEQPAVAHAAIAFKDVHGPDDFGYCTNFVLAGAGMPYEEIRATLAAMGQSAVIVGDDSLIKVHLHLLRPGDALNYAVAFGALDQIEIANMDHQREALQSATSAATAPSAIAAPSSHSAPDTTIGVVAVAPGPGFAAIFRSLNVGAVVGGGQTMNPSTQELLDAIEQLPQHEVIVLPNNSNIIMAARQSVQLSHKRIEVLPSKTVPQGIAAMVGFNYQAGLQENMHSMQEAMRHIRTAEVTKAVRDAVVDRIAVRAGQTIGLLDGDLVTAADEQAPVIDVLLQHMELDTCEILTIYSGQAVAQHDVQVLVERIQKRFPEIAVEVQEGGQPLYEYIISAE